MGLKSGFLSNGCHSTHFHARRLRIAALVSSCNSLSRLAQLAPAKLLPFVVHADVEIFCVPRSAAGRVPTLISHSLAPRGVSRGPLRWSSRRRCLCGFLYLASLPPRQPTSRDTGIGQVGFPKKKLQLVWLGIVCGSSLLVAGIDARTCEYVATLFCCLKTKELQGTTFTYYAFPWWSLHFTFH